jgi:hypothetical protein
VEKLKKENEIKRKKEAEEKAKIQKELLKKKEEADKIKSVKDKVKAEEAITAIEEKLKKLKECYKTCSETEMPFMTGFEVLPEGQSETVLKEMTDAATAALAAMNDARTFLKAKHNECKGYTKDVNAETSEQLKPLTKEINELEAKVNTFKKELGERKMNALLASVMDPVKAAEKLAKALEPTAKALRDSNLEDETIDNIKATIEKAKASLGEATKQVADARKAVLAKQKESRAAQNDPQMAKILSRIDGAQANTSSLRSAIDSAEKIVRAKLAAVTGEEKTKDAESQAAKVEKLVEGATLTVDLVASLDEACSSAVSSIKLAGSVIQPQVGPAPPKTKATLQALLERKAAAQKVVEKVKADTKQEREEVLSDAILKEAETNTKAIETAGEGLEAAEKPFLLGMEYKLNQLQEFNSKAMEAVGKTKEALNAGRKFTDSKRQVVKSYGEASMKKVNSGFADMAERVKVVTSNLANFEKELKERIKHSKMLEAVEKVDELEGKVNETVQAAEPFTKEDAEKMSEAEAAAPLKVFMDIDKETHNKLVVAKGFLNERLKDQAGKAENIENIKKLQERVEKFKEALAPAKKATAPHEARSLGTRLLAEAKEQVAGLPAEIKKASDACVPLLEQGGIEYLVAASVKTLISALQAHMKEKELTVEALFKEAAGKGNTFQENEFVEYLSKLPEAIGHDELNAFSDERRAAIFKYLASDGKAVKESDFETMFRQKYLCSKGVTLTDKYELDGAETLCKVEPSMEVELFGVQKDDAAGMCRSQCTVGDKKGWITIRQANGPVFLTLVSPFQSLCSTMDKAIAQGSSAVSKVSNDLNSKMKQGGTAAEGPLKEAREEMAKLKTEISNAVKSMDDLKRAVATAKKEYSQKERSEAIAHIEAKNLKDAAPFVDGPKALVDALEALSKAAEEASAPMAALSAEDLETFATPASVLEAMEKSTKEITEKANEAREAVKEQTKAASEASPQSGGTTEAKKQLKGMSWKIDALGRQASKTLSVLKAKAVSIAGKKMELVSAAIRKQMQAKGLSGEGLFDSMKEGEKIPEAAFCKFLESLEGLSLTAEVAKLVCRQFEADGISKDTLMTHVVLYYKVIRPIAFTDVLDITKCNTLRKIDLGEVVELLEGPVTDEVNGITRVRAKALKGKPCEGWVTVCGNQGTTFLEKTKKP